MRRKFVITTSAFLALLLLIPLAFATSENLSASVDQALITMTSSYTPTTLPEGERPPAPTPLSPGHRSHTTDTSPTFFWSPVNGAVNYRIMVFDHKLPSVRTVDIRQNTPNTFIVLSNPLQPDRYFWRMRARAQGTWSRWSIRFTLWVDEILPTPTITPPPVITVTPSLTSGQPDLFVQSARIELENGTVCDTWGTGVDIHNQGDAAAGPFHVLVDGVELFVPGLAAGQTTYVWKSGTANPTNITVDNQDEVAESNESNNTFSMMLPIPTLPVHCTWTDTPTPTPGGPTDTPTPTIDGLPDLYVQAASIELENGNNCDNGLGTGVTVHNQGDAAAGPFDVLVDGDILPVIGLGVSQSTYVWKAGYSNPTNIMVDDNNAVAESDETNNAFSMMLPIPTLPIECTWTDTPTPTPGGVTDTPTPTPTPIGTPTPLPDLLVHYVTNGLRPPCLGAPMAVEFGVTNWGDENVPSFVYSVNGTQVPLITPIPPQATLVVMHDDADRNIVNNGPIVVILDPFNAIPEWNEANNIGTAFPLTLTPPAPCP